MNPERPPSPAFALVRRELLVLARNPRLFGLMAGMTTVLALAALTSLSFTSLRNGQMAGFARSIFGTQFFLLYVAALIVVPAMAAAAIVHERKQDCYPLLLTTLIPPRWIVWSKLIALLGLYTGLYAGVLPFTGIIYFFAGVEPLALIQGIIVCFSLALGTTSIGLLASASARDHSRAIYHTGLGVLCMLLLPWAARVFLEALGIPRMDWLQSVGPFNAYAVVRSGLPDWRPPLAFAMYQGCVACFCVVLTRHFVVPRRGDYGQGLPANMLDRLRWRPAYRFIPIADTQNPVAAKDYRASDFSRGLGPWLLVALGLATGSFGYSITHTFPQRFAPLIEFYLLIVILPAVVSSLVLREHQDNMIGSLGVTLLTAKEITRGKVTAALRILRMLVWGFVLGRVLAYGGITLWGLIEGGPGGPLSAINPAPLLLSLAELFICLWVIPRFALAGALASSSPLAVVFSSYAFILISWAIVSTLSAIVTAFMMMGSFGDPMDGYEIVFLLGQKTVKYFFLIVAARIAMESATTKLASKLISGWK